MDLQVGDVVRLIKKTGHYNSGRIRRINERTGEVYVCFSGQDFGTHTTVDNLEKIDLQAEARKEHEARQARRQKHLAKYERLMAAESDPKRLAIFGGKIAYYRGVLNIPAEQPEPPALTGDLPELPPIGR